MSTPNLVWFVNSRPQIIDLTVGDWTSKAAIVNWVASAISPSTPSSAVVDSCTSRVGGLCLPVSAPVFYFIIVAASLHILQAIAWIVVARQKHMQLFSLKHFLVVLIIPIFGLFMWLQLCRFQKSPKNRDTLLTDMDGEKTPAKV